MPLRIFIPFALAFASTAVLAAPLPAPRPPGLVPAKEQSAPAEKKETENDAAVPLPVPRPEKIEEPALSGPVPPPPGLVEAEVPLDPLPDPVCDELEASGEVEFERLDRIIDNQCGALTPIRLKAFAPKDGQRVTLTDPATVTCAVARQTLVWLTTAVQPAAQKHFGSPVVKFRQTGGYECRGRNRVAGAKMSEHGLANALDIGGFERADGSVTPVSPEGAEADLNFLKEIREAACGPFTTVLGPGVAAHDEHFHLDLAKRGRNKNALYCR